MNMTHKGYGRIYVETPADVERVSEIIKEMDEFEHSYMPGDFIAPFAEYPHVVYTHKFSDLDMAALTATCLARGVRNFAVDAGYNEWPKSEIKAQ